ncbi:COG2192 Predicted carbamoyl transferase, NodU family [uncultured Caudovirales phage]|uniref:COG2192 Predicted carbamoyl transferase, NodU family n=1 Tax=uncultured Caudovirales phage TaxID=2100421 RepID=A0A6J5NH29_9CAUD|nr:COG2192 Predicted carbamoyl transferase, NodU family [uncultured Caudovirales phage]
MIILGINDSSHDASLAVLRDTEILFAAHAERYNKEKNTYSIPSELLNEALSHGKPDVIAYFEKRNRKRLRHALLGGINGEYKNLYKKNTKVLDGVAEVQVGHHRSHASAGYYTSGFSNATTVVIDAIGEFETATIWDCSGVKLKKVYSTRYPTSFGLFYSAFTKLLDLKPGTEEYILMGMAGFGDRGRFYEKVNSYFPKFNFQPQNMHTGISENSFQILSEQDKYDIAAAVQSVYEDRLIEFMAFAKKISKSDNLVFMGGCALNCVANTKLLPIWKNIWIMPNPGDSGSSLGAAASIAGRHLEWSGPYLGYEINNNYQVDNIVNNLVSNGIVGVASGRAEFGPRALGNRSLLADPRAAFNKDAVNKIKKREMFRPFAPVVLEEHASEWFDMDRPSPYMQFAFRCLKSEIIPAVVHVDGTSRVQTVSRVQHEGLYSVLKKWFEITGVPVLLNTSLNIKNQPLLNDEDDARMWDVSNPGILIL